MKKVLIASMLFAATAVYAGDNWVNSSGDPWRNSSGQCWRNSSWTPATAHPDCDGALKPAAPTKVAQADPKELAKKLAPTLASAAATPAPVSKVSLAGDTLFDFDKSVIKPAGKVMLDELVAKIKNITLEVVIAVGHTDSVGTDTYNLKLGARRAEAVKAYLVSKGIEKNRVYTESKGESQPIADNKTAAGRAKNRRVEIEVVGTNK